MFRWISLKFNKLMGLSDDLRNKIVESARKEFHKSLNEVENYPESEKAIEKSYELGFEYKSLARELDIEMETSRDDFDIIKDVSVAQFRGMRNISKMEKDFDEDNSNLAEIMVVISSNWGDIPMKLTDWIAKGPGIRFLRRPIRAWNLRTGEDISLNEIPIQYRNNEESREKIKNGEIPDPWEFAPDW